MKLSRSLRSGRGSSGWRPCCFLVRCFEAKRGAKSSAQLDFKIVWWPSSRNQVDGVFFLHFWGSKIGCFQLDDDFLLWGPPGWGETSAGSQALKNFLEPKISVVFKAPQS